MIIFDLGNIGIFILSIGKVLVCVMYSHAICISVAIDSEWKEKLKKSMDGCI